MTVNKRLASRLRIQANTQRILAASILEFADPLVVARQAMGSAEALGRLVDELEQDGKRGTETWANAQLDWAIAKGKAQELVDSPAVARRLRHLGYQRQDGFWIHRSGPQTKNGSA